MKENRIEIRKIPGFGGHYSATSDGRIFTNWNKNGVKELKGKKDRYVQYALTDDDGRTRTMLGHRLIAITFIPNPEGKAQVNHKNGNRHDNRVENLEWATSFENMNHAYANGLDTRCSKVLKLDSNGNLIAEYRSIREAARLNGCSPQIIKYHYTQGTAFGGYIWNIQN